MIKGKGEEVGIWMLFYMIYNGRTSVDRCTPRETHMQEPKRPWLFVPETIENMG